TWFDTALPAPDRSAAKNAPESGAPKAGSKPAPEPIPEDPEEGPGAKPAKQAPEAAAPKSWGSGSAEPDQPCAAMIVVRDEKEYGTLLDRLAKSKPALKTWIEIARKQTGLVLEEPLSGAYVENAAGQEEWNADHELLNRVVQLMCLRRFGQQPNWIVQGIAWNAEMA